MRRFLTLAVVSGALAACGTILDTTPIETAPKADAGPPTSDARVIDDVGVPSPPIDAMVADTEAGPQDSGRCQERFGDDFSRTNWTPTAAGWSSTGAPPTIESEHAVFTSGINFAPTVLSRQLKPKCATRIELKVRHGVLSGIRFEFLRLLRGDNELSLSFKAEQFLVQFNDVQRGAPLLAPNDTWFTVIINTFVDADTTVSFGTGSTTEVALEPLPSGPTTEAPLTIGLVDGSNSPSGVSLLVDDVHVE